EQARVAVGDLAPEVDLDVVDRVAVGEPDRDPAERAAQREERAEHLHVLRRDCRHVDRARHDPAGESRHDLLCRLEPPALGWRRAGSAAWAVEAPGCGVTITFGCPTRGLAAGGSERYTSSAAPATLPESSAACRSSSTISGPRATFSTRTPSLHFDSALASSQPSVSGVLGRRSVRKSATAYILSAVAARSTPTSS